MLTTKIFNKIIKIIGLSTTGFAVARQGFGIINQKFKNLVLLWFVNNVTNQKLFYFFVLYFMGVRAIFSYEKQAVIYALLIVAALFLFIRILNKTLKPGCLVFLNYLYYIYFLTFLVLTEQIAGGGLTAVILYSILHLLKVKTLSVNNSIDHHYSKEFFFFDELKKTMQQICVICLPLIHQNVAFLNNNEYAIKIAPLLILFFAIHFMVFGIIDLVIIYASNPITQNFLVGCVTCGTIGLTYFTVINLTGLNVAFEPLNLPFEGLLQERVFGVRTPSNLQKNSYQKMSHLFPSHCRNLPVIPGTKELDLDATELLFKTLVNKEAEELAASSASGFIRGSKEYTLSETRRFWSSSKPTKNALENKKE
jgi:hypothetical protein